MSDTLTDFDVTACKQSSVQGFKFAVDESGQVQGLGSVFGNVDSAGERVVAGAFGTSIRKHHSQGTMPAMLWQHRMAEPVGRWSAMQEDGVGLRMVGQINLNTTRGRDAYEHLKADDISGLSIGYREIKTRPNGQVVDLLELDLMEVSIVSMPANPRARVTGVKAESSADVERILREGGLPRAFAAKFAKAGWAALAGETAEPDPQLNELFTAVKAARLEIKGL